MFYDKDDKLWIVPLRKYIKPLAWRAPGDAPPKLYGLYASGMDAMGNPQNEMEIELSVHPEKINDSKRKEGLGERPDIPSGQLERGQKDLLEKQKSVYAIKMEPAIKIVNYKDKSNFPSGEELAEMFDYRMAELCERALGFFPVDAISTVSDNDRNHIYEKLKRVTVGHSGMTLGPN